MNRNEKALIRMVDVQLLLRERHSKAEISRQLGVSYETIRRHINDYHQNERLAQQAIRDSLLWVGIQVERGNLKRLEGQEKVHAILSLLYKTNDFQDDDSQRALRAAFQKAKGEGKVEKLENTQ